MNKAVTIILTFVTLFGNAQSNIYKNKIDKLSNKDLKNKLTIQLSDFDKVESYINKNQAYFTINSNVINDSINLNFYSSVSSLYKKLKNDYNLNSTTKNKPEDWKIIDEIYKSNLKSIDSLYNLRNVAYTDAIKLNKNSNKAQIETAKKQSELGRISPSHSSCNSIDTTKTSKETCFNNFIRQKIGQSIYIPEFRIINEDFVKSFVTFIINKNGKLEFKKFAKSTGYFEYDMEVYLQFVRINKNMELIPGYDVQGNKLDFYYTLPLTISTYKEE